MNHDTGPWTAVEKSSHFQIVNDTDFPIAEVYGKSAFGRELCEANAHLIAAAPDLLAACKAALADCEQDGWENSPLGLQLKAAIAKAEPAE